MNIVYENTIHKTLGDNSILGSLKKNFVNLWNSIKIIKYSSNCNSKIIGNTIPHAGFEYSGLIGLFSIADLFYESQYNTNEITILWFKHSLHTEYEHSLKNVIDLCYLLFPHIKINNIYIDYNSRLENLEIKPPILVSTDFSHHNYCISKKNLYEV